MLKGLLLTVGLAFCGPVAAQKSLPPIPTGYGSLAVTYWECANPAPQSFYLPELVNDPAFGEVRAHEQFHQRQMLRIGCEAWHKANRDPAFRLAAEAQAFCAMLYFNVATFRIPQEEAMSRAAVWFSDYARTTPGKAAELIAVFAVRGPDCGLPPAQ